MTKALKIHPSLMNILEKKSGSVILAFRISSQDYFEPKDLKRDVREVLDKIVRYPLVAVYDGWQKVGGGDENFSDDSTRNSPFENKRGVALENSCFVDAPHATTPFRNSMLDSSVYESRKVGQSISIITQNKDDSVIGANQSPFSPLNLQVKPLLSNPSLSRNPRNLANFRQYASQKKAAQAKKDHVSTIFNSMLQQDLSEKNADSFAFSIGAENVSFATKNRLRRNHLKTI